MTLTIPVIPDWHTWICAACGWSWSSLRSSVIADVQKRHPAICQGPEPEVRAEEER